MHAPPSPTSAVSADWFLLAVERIERSVTPPALRLTTRLRRANADALRRDRLASSLHVDSPTTD